MCIVENDHLTDCKMRASCVYASTTIFLAYTSPEVVDRNKVQIAVASLLLLVIRSIQDALKSENERLINRMPPRHILVALLFPSNAHTLDVEMHFSAVCENVCKQNEALVIVLRL